MLRAMQNVVKPAAPTRVHLHVHVLPGHEPDHQVHHVIHARGQIGYFSDRKSLNLFCLHCSHQPRGHVPLEVIADHVLISGGSLLLLKHVHQLGPGLTHSDISIWKLLSLSGEKTILMFLNLR